MKNLIKILIVALVFIHNTSAQTIKKEASNNNPYIGEEFYYTFTIENLTDLSDLDRIEDSFGPELDYVGVDYNPSMLALLNVGFGIGCVSYDDNNSTLHDFRLDFYNCNGITIGGLDSFSFKVKVKLNKEACLKNTYENEANLYLHSNPQKPITSNLETITVNKNDPFQLQKTFRSSANGELVYDIRLSSQSGNFYPMDFDPAVSRTFRDTFTIPTCLTIGISDVDVVLIEDETTTPMRQSSSFTYNKSINGNIVNIDWELQGATEDTSSILYQVKFKTNDCSACGNGLFQIQNQADFSALDKCGNPISKKEEFNIDSAACINAEVEVPTPIDQKICIEKRLELDGNNLNLTMKGCTGRYIITVNNCSGRIIYKNFILTDIISQELNVNGPVTIIGNATYTMTNQTITVNSSAYLNPNETVEISIPFKVATAQENLRIDNCTDISLYGYDSIISSISYNVTEQACATPLVTVPNKVAIVANKTLCSDAGTSCGPFTNPYNLPGDTVEYALHFYNYGTVEARGIKIKDVLPQYFKIQNINTDVQVFRVKRTNISNVCEVTSNMRDVTQRISKNYSTATNLLEIDMQNMDLEEFTCEGVVQYIIKIKAEIDLTTPNGTYENIYTIGYKDPSTNSSHVEVSNKVTNVVNVDNLVLGYKGFNGENTNDYIITDCDAKTTTVSYKIVMANMGSYNVYAEVDDMVSVPNGVSIANIGNFQKSVNGSVFSPITVNNVTANGFNNLTYMLYPCEVTVITYDVVYNTNLLSKNETVQACNNASVRVYPKDERFVNAVFTSNPSLINNYSNAKTDKQKLEAISLIKSVQNTLNKKRPKNPNTTQIFKTELNRVCVSLTDCLKGAGSGCFTDTSQPFNFKINGINANGQISTTLSNSPNNKITKIEYLLTDIRQIDTCEDEEIIITRPRRRLFINNCFGCSPNVTGEFSTTDTTALGGLNFINQPSLSGLYSALNKVEFSGVPTVITQDNRTFNFPVGLNCNGTYEFTITAIVHFEDCSVCYVTDTFDYNARFRFRLPNPRVPILTGPRLP